MHWKMNLKRSVALSVQWSDLLSCVYIVFTFENTTHETLDKFDIFFYGNLVIDTR